jgi:putative redox protein
VKVTARRQGEEGFAHEVETDDGHRFVIDEPATAGGDDLGPRPTALLASSLAGCTAITLELYAARKGWDLGEIEVDVEVDLEQPAFDVAIRLSGELGSEQRERLLKIASKCPVHRVLAAETKVRVSDRIESA